MELANGELTRLDKLEEHSARTEGRLGAIERTQVDHGLKLDHIGNGLQTLTLAIAKSEGKPQFKLADFISTARDIFAIGAVCAGFALWYVTTLTAKSDAILAKDNEILAIKLQHTADKLTWLENRFSWKPTLEALTPR